jgi:hypothetical protein
MLSISSLSGLVGALAVFALTTTTLGQERMVIPSDLVDVEGNAVAGYRGNAKAQILYANTLFDTNSAYGYDLLGIAFRLKSTAGQFRPSPYHSVWDMEIRLSSDAYPRFFPFPMGPEDFPQSGPDATVVFPRTNLTVSLGWMPGRVNPFSMYFPFKQPFHYNAKNGTLLVEIEFFDLVWPYSGDLSPFFDADAVAIDNSGVSNSLITIQRSPDYSIFAGGPVTEFWLESAPYARSAGRNEQWGREFSADLNGRVEALAIDSKKNLIVAGRGFGESAGNESVLLTFIGDQRVELASGTSGAVVNAVVVNEEEIFIGGTFDSINGVSAKNLAKWDGGAWSEVGGGVQGAYVKSVIHKDGQLYVGGSFTNVGGVEMKNIARWDGFRWLAMGEGLPGEVAAFAVNGQDVFAGGNFVQSSGIPQIARFDGSTWKPLGLGVNGTVRTMAFFDGKLFVGGTFDRAGGRAALNVAVWDGVKWSELRGGVRSENSSGVHAITSDGRGGVFVGGDFTIAGNSPASRIAHWDGESWRTLGRGIDGIVKSLVLRGRELFAAGDFNFAGDNENHKIARWQISDLLLAAAKPTPAGEVVLEARGMIGQKYVVQQSVDLINWESISTNEFVTTNVFLQIGGGAQGFYQLRAAD